MRSFSDLLRQHIERAGITDAELARRLNVSRQTIFRWREGETQRPRHQEVVVRLASTLRLTNKERDRLLIAAGFPPEGRAIGADSDATDSPTVEAGQPDSSPRARLPALALLAAAVVAIAILALTPIGDRLLLLLPRDAPQPAAPGEFLIVVSPFHNYSGASTGYNVAGRVQEAIESALQEGEVPARVEILPSPIADQSEAIEQAERLRASLVIWGEYDSGRILAHTTAPPGDGLTWAVPRRWQVSSTEELSTTININVPAELQWISLTILGRVHLAEGRLNQAAATFHEALSQGAADDRSEALLFFYLGLVESQQEEGSLDDVIAYYSEAIARRPQLASALNNRGLAYLQRGQPGDHVRATADFQHAAELAPELAAPVLNMSVAMQSQLDDPGQLDVLLAWLERAEQHLPADPNIQNALCWYYTLSGDPQQGLQHCERALELDDLTAAHDSRGLALALLGREEEAVEEFKLYLHRLELEDPELFQKLGPRRERWITALEAGEDPFSEAVMKDLLSE